MIGNADLIHQILKPLLDVFLSPAVLRVLIPLLILAAIVSILRTPIVKGWIGEGVVNLQLKLLLNKQRYHLVKNVTLPCDDRTTQIDHVVVSRCGIFVIETKNMRGWIFGSEKEATWTQKFHRSSRQFQNPLRQNYKHVAVLAEMLDLPAACLKSVIMFIGDAKLKSEMPPNVLDRGLAKYITSHKVEILTDEQVTEVLEAIAQQRLAPGLRTHVNHVKNVKAIIAEKDGRITAVTATQTPAYPVVQAVQTDVPAVAIEQAPVCPRCGRTMVLRVAKSGVQAGKEFWGCSGFPKCRSILKRG